jgi:hypothetical protein
MQPELAKEGVLNAKLLCASDLFAQPRETWCRHEAAEVSFRLERVLDARGDPCATVLKVNDVRWQL